MPALAETQLPYLLRDIQRGLVSPRKPGESTASYYYELSILYCLPKRKLVNCSMSKSQPLHNGVV